MRKIFLLLLIIALLLGGCTKEELKPLKIGVMADMGAVPIIMAQEKGYFKDLGLDMEIQVFRSALDRDTALQTGNLDGVMADMLSVVFFNDGGFNVKMTSDTYGNYKMVSSPGLDEKTFLSIDKIKIGLSTNTVIDFSTDYIAAKKNIDDKIDKIAIPQMPVRLEMLKNGELNAATLPEPLASAAVMDGGVVIGGTEQFDLYPGIFIFNNNSIENSKKEIGLMYKGIDKGVDFINNTKINEYFDILVDKLGFPIILKDKIEMPKMDYFKAVDENSFNTTLEWMKSKGLTKSDYKLSDVFTDEFVK